MTFITSIIYSSLINFYLIINLSVSFKSNSVVEPQKTEKINPKVSSFGGSVAALTAGALVHQAAPYPIAKTEHICYNIDIKRGGR